MRPLYPTFALAALVVAAACSGKNAVVEPKGIGGTGTGGSSSGGADPTGGTATGGDSGTSGSASGGTAGTILPPLDGGTCQTRTCEELGWACGYTVDECGNKTDCAAEGRMCAVNEVCVGGVDGPTQCMTGGAGVCPLCSSIPDCSEQADVTRLSGRVITPGRDDANVLNQVGVPNATVYLLRTNDIAELPAMPTGIPADGMSCDRCEDQDLGPVLAGAVTDATGAFTIEEYVPVGVEVVLVVKVGRFRRATKLTIPETAACQTHMLPTALPDNPTRLPRNMMDGLAVNIPRIAVSTGQVDAMECVLEKMGIGHAEFTNPGGAGRVQLFRGGEAADPAGARLDDMTPHSQALFGDPATMLGYDLVIADCEGASADDSPFPERDASGATVPEFVNRGGRFFASHLSFSWLHENGATPYDAADPIATGLAAAATWDPMSSSADQATTGTGVISAGRPNSSPRIQNFADWMVNEQVTMAPGYDFAITEPRSRNVGLGTNSEEFVHLTAAMPSSTNLRTQQFSFNTPYGAPAEAACGRVAYSGFHVSAGGGMEAYSDVIFPMHCTGDLTNQEKVLLYMLFDLGACIGEPPPPPPCEPETCESLGAMCGFAPDGCGDVLDCGPCRPPS